MVSSSSELAELTSKTLGKYGGRAVDQVVRLGVPYTAGRAHKATHQNARVKKAMRWEMFISRFAGTSKQVAAKLFLAGARPSADYGADIVGMAKRSVTSLVSMAAASLKMGKGLADDPFLDRSWINPGSILGRSRPMGPWAPYGAHMGGGY